MTSPLHTNEISRRSGSAASTTAMSSPMQAPSAPAASSAAAAAAGSTDSPAIVHPQPAQSVPPINVNSSTTAGRTWLRQTRSTSRVDSSGELVPVDAPLFYSLLVHNLSHSDLMLGIRAPDGTVNLGTETQHNANASSSAAAAAAGSPVSGTSIPPLPPSIVARPKFSRFKQVSSRLLAYVDGAGGGAGALEGIEFPSPLMAQRAPPSISSPPLRNQHSNGPGPAAAASSSSFAAAAASSSSASAGKTTCPYGFRVKDGACKFADWTSFKLKGEDTSLAGGLAKALPKPEIIGVFFPMLAVLVPRWLSIVAGKNARRGILHDNQNKKILYLISGSGTPWNTEHDASGNSTKGVAKLATIFLNQFYPDVEVQILHSGVEIFHYDANVQFVNKELKPRIEEVRRILADKYADKWSKFMHLATTLTDGASARISAINASLRHLRPDCVTGDTLVTMANGACKRIDTLREGEIVLAYTDVPASTGSAASRVLVPRAISAVLDKGVRECVEVLCLDGRKLVCTADHLLLTSSGAWLEAGKIVPNETSLAVGVTHPMAESVEDALDDAAAWSLDTTVALGFALDLRPGHCDRTIAFARLCGYLLTNSGSMDDNGAGEVRAHLVLRHEMDVAAVMHDVALLMGSTIHASSVRRGQTWHVSLSPELSRAFVGLGADVGNRDNTVRRFPPFVTAAECPLAVVRAFLQGLFGGGTSLHLAHNGDDAELRGLGFTMACSGLIAAEQHAALQSELSPLLARSGLLANDLLWSSVFAPAEANSSLVEVRLEIQHDSIQLFSQSIGFAYACTKQLRLVVGSAVMAAQKELLRQRQAVVQSLHLQQQHHPFASFPQQLALAKESVAAKTPLHASVWAWQCDQASRVDDALSTSAMLDLLDARNLLSEKRGHGSEGDGDRAVLPLFAMPVVSVRPTGSHRVYDLTVPTGGGLQQERREASFVANGVVAHNCLHMWQLKSFWHEYPLISGVRVESDVEFHEFDKLEMTPPTLVSETDNWVRMLVKEMIAHKEEFERVRDGDRDRVPNELDSFWLRKSKQPVLSVLMVKKKNRGVKFFRGINVEVSMPTGSLCSERNAIGSALSSDPSLCRKDLRMIAVLALGLEPHSTTSTLSAGMPVPKELIPIAPTTAYGMHASPTRGPISPKLGRYPSITAAQAAQAAQTQASSAVQLPDDVDVIIDTSAVDSAMHDTDLPQSAGRPPLQRATSERSIFQRKGSTSGASGGSSAAAPPTSPALKGKSGPNLTVPLHTNSPRSAHVSPLKQPPMLDDEPAMAPPASTTATPRKRKGAAAANSTSASAQPSPVGTGSVSFASTAAASVSTHSPSLSSTPPIHSPRFGRNNTVPAQAAAAAAAAGGSSQVLAPHAARDISAQLSRSALAGQSSSPAGSPLSPQRSVQTRGNGLGAAAANQQQPQEEETRDKKRAKRSPSVTGAAAAAAAAAASADAASTASASCTPPGHASDSVYASGVVDAEMQRAYLSHELSLVAHRDALHLPPSEVAKLSGNHAPNAITPVDRLGAEDLLAAAGIGGTAMVHSASLGSVGASSVSASKLVVDERNPINPCGSCNEWLKKIAEVNPEFKVITFTATDCSTCFVKAVKF